MEDFATRTTVLQGDGDTYYIGLQLYHSHFGGWTTLKTLSYRYNTYDEARRAYDKLERLGYMDPALYSTIYS